MVKEKAPGIMDRVRHWWGGKVFGAGDLFFQTEPVIIGNNKAAKVLADPIKQVKEYLGTAYACGTINANAVASVPWKLYAITRKGQARPRTRTAPLSPAQKKWVMKAPSMAGVMSEDMEIEQVLDHPVIQLLRDANGMMEGRQLFELLALYLDFTGRAYWHCPKDVTGTVSDIYPLPAQHVIPVWNKEQGMLSHYEYRAGKVQKRFEVDEVLAFNNPDMIDPFAGGVAPAGAAWESIQILRQDLSNTLATYANKGRRDVMITPNSPDGMIGQDQAKRLEYEVNTRYGRFGRGGAWVPMFPLDVKDLTIPPKELESMARYLASKEDVANAFGVPISLLKTDGVNRANAEAGHYQHAKLAVLPRIRRIESRLNQQFIPNFDDRLFIAFDNPVPADEEKDVRVRGEKLKASTLTINEARQQDGLPPVEYGDELMIDGNRRFLSQVANMPDQPAAPVPAKAKSVAPDGSELFCGKGCGCGNGRAVKPKDDAWFKDVPDGDPKIERLFLKWWKRQEKAVIDALEGNPNEYISTGQDPYSVLSNPAWTEEMVQEYAPLIEKWYARGADVTRDRIGLKSTTPRTKRQEIETVMDMPEDYVIEGTLIRAAHDAATMTVAVVNETTDQALKAVQRQVATLASEGIIQRRVITDMIKEAITGISESRAKTIATTEVNRAVHDGQIVFGSQSNAIKGYKPLIHPAAWPTCKQWEQDNPFIPIEKAQKSIGTYDRLIPPIHPNCRSTVLEVFTDELQAIIDSAEE